MSNSHQKQQFRDAGFNDGIEAAVELCTTQARLTRLTAPLVADLLVELSLKISQLKRGKK